MPPLSGCGAKSGRRDQFALDVPRKRQPSEFESFARELKRAKASGHAIEYPVELHDTAPFRAHYFFADEFELEEASPELLRQGVGYLLRPKRSH